MSPRLGEFRLNDLGHMADRAIADLPAKFRPDLGVLDLEEIETPYYSFLWILVNQLWPLRALEIGTYRGAATSVMADASEGRGDIISIDSAFTSEACQRTRRWPNVTLIQQNSHVVPRVLGTFPTIELLFIDTKHTKNQSRGDFDLYWPLLAKGGILVCDDINLNEDMREFWRSIPEPKLNIERLHHTGFGVKIKE